jgi:type I restriction-modification system DNA methylase subunit
MGAPAEVRSILEQFVDDLNSSVEAHRLEELLEGRDSMEGPDVGSKPESWTRKHLIRPLLDISDLEWEPEIHGGGEGYPDFGINNLDVLVIGEDKSINKVDEAEEEVKEYLNNRAASRDAEYGIATDGIQWKVYRIELGGDYLNYAEIAEINFRSSLLQIARNKNYISQSSVVSTDIDEAAEDFYDVFERDEFNTLLTQEAPKILRRQKKQGVEEFYDLYVELLFGEGTGDHSYETTLIDDIQAPTGSTETDRRKFAIKLVNRLLFVKFLEDRDVLPPQFLNDRVINYQKANDEIDDIGGGLYKSQLEPLFFSLFNAEESNRISKHQGSWFDDVPYLNGSLFAPEEREREYDVDDRMLITVVKDLVEGSKLESENGDGSLDPSVLGNVFEMTINHISGSDEDDTPSQKKEGAYYTPSDVIRLINRQTVDPKIYSILVDTYSENISEKTNMDRETAEELVSDYGLGEMLREIEQQQSYFNDSDSLKEAYNRLGSLKIVDPACGSGHFLTGVFDEIHRVRMSLLRGLEGNDLDDDRIYEAKKDLVLNSIYGVDVNPIAIEIAKLRVWLKMVEEGWEESYGELPNIDVNIVDGNSLIGLPAKSQGQSMLKAFDVDLSSIQTVREEYKNGEINRRELDDRVQRLKPEIRQKYLDQINHYLEERIESKSEWEDRTGSLDMLYPSFRKITVRRSDENKFNNSQKAKLADAGFNIETRYEKSAKVVDDEIDDVDSYSDFLDGDYIFEVERQPLLFDLNCLENLKNREDTEALSYEPFHWPIEFPEAASSNGSSYTVEFDLVVGNPPYGDLITDVEDRFTEGYKTNSMNEIVAPFIERQVQILNEGGYFGNIVTMRFMYQTHADPARKVVRDSLLDTRIACFTRRPTQVFEGSQPRSAVITGLREDNETESVRTSRFLRFSEDEREEAFQNISYQSTEGYTLGEQIGRGDKSMPKIGTHDVKEILTELKESSDTVFSDKMSRKDSQQTPHEVWRREGMSYFVNPLLENLYPDGDKPREVKPMYFDSELERKAAFLALQSSTYYLFWMVYGNERHLPWKLIDGFPFPDVDMLEENREEVIELADKLWGEMSDRFKGGSRETIKNSGVLKPIMDEADDLLGPMYGLSEEQIEFVKQYDEKYRLNDVDQSQLVEFE